MKGTMTTTYETIKAAIDDAMMRTEGLPSHVWVLGLRGSRKQIKAAAERAGAWVREYDEDAGQAVVACL